MKSSITLNDRAFYACYSEQMQYVRTARRSVLLALTLLSACAASDPPAPGSDMGQVPAGVIGNFLAGRFAMAEGDPSTAANDLLKALA